MSLRINQNAVSSYPHKILVAVDFLLGVVDGLPYDITISTYVGMVADGLLEPQYMPNFAWKTKLCKWVASDLEKIQPGHCKAARLADLQRAQEAETFCLRGLDPT